MSVVMMMGVGYAMMMPVIATVRMLMKMVVVVMVMVVVVAAVDIFMVVSMIMRRVINMMVMIMAHRMVSGRADNVPAMLVMLVGDKSSGSVSVDYPYPHAENNESRADS